LILETLGSLFFHLTDRLVNGQQRSRISSEDLATAVIEGIVNIHLDLYWPEAGLNEVEDHDGAGADAGAGDTSNDVKTLVDDVAPSISEDGYQPPAEDIVVKVEQETLIGFPPIHTYAESDAGIESVGSSHPT
jgi:hypothetical protein